MKTAPPSILLIEDTRSLSLLYESVLTNAGFEVECAFLAAEAERKHEGADGRLVLLDLMLPDGDGLELLARMRARDPGGKVIVITANGSINRAVEAMRGGAFDFLVKPFDERRLLSAVNNAFEEISGPERLASPGDEPKQFRGFIGSSPRMQEIFRLIGDIGRSTATVFITGESGSGKELAAQAIHAESGRADGPFIALNCAAIPRDLLESEVFGHLKGSFTGAISDKQGAAAAADGGTLFLDEICEMDLALQSKLLRFLQTSTVTPVGATAPRKVDARIICATNRDPEQEVRDGRFREDLFYRLHVVPIHMPPLRERGDDVIEAAESFLRRYAGQEQKAFTRLGDDLKEALMRHSWPGNLRQLQNVIWNMVILHDGEIATAEMLPAGFQSSSGLRAGAAPREPGAEQDIAAGVQSLIGASLAEVEREFIEATIAANQGSVPRAAAVLGVSPSTIYRKRESWAKES